MTDSSSRAFLLDPKAVLSDGFEKAVIEKFKQNYFGEILASGVAFGENSVQTDEKIHGPVLKLQEEFDALVGEVKKRGGMIDWNALLIEIRKKLPEFNYEILAEAARSVVKENMDMESIRELAKKGKLVFLLGDENRGIDEAINNRVRRLIADELADKKKGEYNITNLFLDNLFLNRRVREHDVLFISGHKKGKKRSEQVRDTARDLIDLGLKTFVVDRDENVLNQANRELSSRNERGLSLFHVGKAEGLNPNVRNANSLKEFAFGQNKTVEGVNPAAGIPSPANV